MRFREVTLQASDPEGLVTWYRTQLGLPAAQEVPGEPVGVIVGATTLRFERAPSGVQPQYHVAFNVPEDRIEDALRWVSARAPVMGVEEGPVVEYRDWDAHAVYFLDPVGNVLELIARHALKNGSDRPFDGGSLLNVSEVGLPCPSVPELAGALKAGLGVPEYRPMRPRFAPLGDEHGLLILVPQGRPWFPGQEPAWPFPLRVVHEGPALALDASVLGLPFWFLSA